MAESVLVDHLSKQFVIGSAARDTMVRERLVSLLSRPFRRPPAPTTIWALRDVSFSVGEGEVVGIVGRNGAGKSTLLKILSRITHPTSGRIRTHGHVASLLEVGTGFHDELTGRENVYLNGSILGMKKREVDSKLDAIVAFSGVEAFLDTPIKRYSSGMRLRLGFAVAAHLDPDVLIIDEVLAVGDAGFQKKCLNVMGELRQSGRTVLFVSHNMAAVENLCSRAVWIDEGLVRMDGPARDVIHSYMDTFAPSEQGAADLGRVDHRSGTGEIRYTRIEFLGADGSPQPVTRSGDRVVMRFHYAARTPIPYPSLGFRMYTELGTLITDTSTWHHGISIPMVGAGEGYIDLDISLLNLLPGNYSLSLWITGDGQRVYDGIEHCATLEVEAANVYRSARIVDGRYGLVFFPQTWRLDGICARAAALDVQVSA